MASLSAGRATGVGEVAAGVDGVAAGGDDGTGVGSLGPLGISGASPVKLPKASGPLGCPRGASTAGTDRLGEEAAGEGAADGVGRVAGGAEAALLLESAADVFLGEGLSPGATMSRTRVPDDAREEGATMHTGALDQRCAAIRHMTCAYLNTADKFQRRLLPR